MTGRERVVAAMRREAVDYAPCCPFMNPQDWVQRVGKRWQYPFGPSVAETVDYMVRQLGVDQVINFSVSYYPDSRVSSKAWIEGDVIHKVYSTPAGELRAAVRFDDGWIHGPDVPFFSDYNPSHFVEPWIKSLADVECLRYILLPPRTKDEIESVRFSYREAKTLADKYGLATCFSFGLGLTGALLMFGPAALCELALTNPDLVDAYLGVDHQWTLKGYEIALGLGADIVRRNGFYETCDFFSPALLDRFLTRRIGEEIRLVHEAGRVIGYTVLTGYGPMLDHLGRLDFDSIVCPDPFLRGGDAVELNRRLGDRKSFWTGPSDTLHMPWERPEEVRKAVQRVFDVFGKSGLILTPCSSSKGVFPWVNVLAMVEEWKRLR